MFYSSNALDSPISRVLDQKKCASIFLLNTCIFNGHSPTRH